MSVTIRLDGVDEVGLAFLRMSEDVRNRTALAIRDTAQELEAAIKLKIQQGTKSGRTYRRGGVSHQASAPGQSPATDTGALIGSISHQREGARSYSVGARVSYAAYLEYGTSRMGARPYFRPAIEDIKPVFRGRLEEIIRRAAQ
jgi:HK97 gp10 family phage protein